MSYQPTAIVYAPTNQPANAPLPGNSRFNIGVFEVGDCNSCMYSCFCPSCALASARSNLDGSDWCFNCFILNPTITRHLVRSSYGIEGSWVDDCLLGGCCGPCVVNQLYQTTLTRKNPTVDSGRQFNVNGFQSQPGGNSCGECCANCMYASFCTSCANGTILENTANIPFVLGCFCSNICLTRNIVRYQYRLRGSDCGDDCLSPTLIMCGAYICSYCIPCTMCAAWGYLISLVMQMLSESSNKKSTNGGTASPYMYHPNVSNNMGMTGTYIINQPTMVMTQPAPVIPMTYVTNSQPTPVTYVANQPGNQQPVYVSQPAVATPPGYNPGYNPGFTSAPGVPTAEAIEMTDYNNTKH